MQLLQNKQSKIIYLALVTAASLGIINFVGAISIIVFTLLLITLFICHNRWYLGAVMLLFPDVQFLNNIFFDSRILRHKFDIKTLIIILSIAIFVLSTGIVGMKITLSLLAFICIIKLPFPNISLGVVSDNCKKINNNK